MPTVSWPMYCLPGSSPHSLRALASPAMQRTQVRLALWLFYFDSFSPSLPHPCSPSLSLSYRISEQEGSMVQREICSLLTLKRGSFLSGFLLSYHKVEC